MSAGAKITAKYVGSGKSMPYRSDRELKCGDVVVVNDLVGIAEGDIAKGEVGELSLSGVYEFELPKERRIDKGSADRYVGLPVFWNAGYRMVSIGGSYTYPYVFIGHVVAVSEDGCVVSVRLCQRR